MKKILIVPLLFSLSNISIASDVVKVVGSSTVYPFATVVAENFGRGTEHKAPIIESTGSGGGLKLFCAGKGPSTPDITNASRRIKSKEVKLCAKNGITNITENKIGFDGIVFANVKTSERLNITRKDLYLALAKNIPCGLQDGVTCENDNKTWKDVRSDLPNTKIQVYGPPPTSGTRDAFAELALGGGCKQIPWIKKLKKKNKKEFKKLCYTVREDGAYVEAGENDNLIIQKLQSAPDSFGVFGFSFLDQNTDTVQGSIVDGVEPTFDNIASGKYKVSRSLYFYVKNDHADMKPAIHEFVKFFMNEDAIGDDGYLVDRGLIPLPSEERSKYIADAKSLTKLQY